MADNQTEDGIQLTPIVRRPQVERENLIPAPAPAQLEGLGFDLTPVGRVPRNADQNQPIGLGFSLTPLFSPRRPASTAEQNTSAAQQPQSSPEQPARKKTKRRVETLEDATERLSERTCNCRAQCLLTPELQHILLTRYLFLGALTQNQKLLVLLFELVSFREVDESTQQVTLTCRYGYCCLT